MSNWTLELNDNSIYLMNMAKLSNCISIHKNTGYGDKEFYVGFNNENARQVRTVRDLELFLAEKFKKDPIPRELFELFKEHIGDYQ